MSSSIQDIVFQRKSVRAFLDKPVSSELIKSLLIASSRSPSGGNLQPWRIFILNKAGMNQFLNFQHNWEGVIAPAYDIYPPNLKEPYRTSRYKVGEQMYELLDIARDDKEARTLQALENFKFFGAPAALFCFLDKDMGPPQWSDCGMFLQTFMLLAAESGLDTCAQEAWAMKEQCIKEFFSIPKDLGIFCGMAIGYGDTNAAINKLQTEREPFSNWAQFIE
jgi:nitroreductase